MARNFAVMETYPSRVDRHHRYHCAILCPLVVFHWGYLLLFPCSKIVSGCIGVCVLEDDICIGCLRTIEEITMAGIKHGTRVNNVPSLSRKEKKKNKNLSNRKIRQAGKSSILEVLSGK